MKLEQAVALFLGEYIPTTRKAYSHALIPMSNWIGPAREVSGIRPALLVEYVQTCIEGRADLAAATKRKLVKGIKTFFNWCVRIELLKKSPAVQLRAHKVPRRISREKAMTDAELDALLAYVRFKTVPRDLALILFISESGCRRGGAAGLRLADIDWNGLRATVTEKGEQSRLVAFSDLCARALRHWLAYRSAHYRVKGVYVFSHDGAPVRPAVLAQAIRRDCQKAGIRSLGPHSLRHRKGHQLADSRVAPSVAATALGHSDPLITVTYYYPDDWETAERELRALMTQDEGRRILRLNTGD